MKVYLECRCKDDAGGMKVESYQRIRGMNARSVSCKENAVGVVDFSKGGETEVVECTSLKILGDNVMCIGIEEEDLPLFEKMYSEGRAWIQVV